MEWGMEKERRKNEREGGLSLLVYYNFTTAYHRILDFRLMLALGRVWHLETARTSDSHLSALDM